MTEPVPTLGHRRRRPKRLRLQYVQDITRLRAFNQRRKGRKGR